MQRKYQIKLEKEGKCGLCGVPATRGTYCDIHYMKNLIRSRKRHGVDPNKPIPPIVKSEPSRLASEAVKGITDLKERARIYRRVYQRASHRLANGIPVDAPKMKGGRKKKAKVPKGFVGWVKKLLAL